MLTVTVLDQAAPEPLTPDDRRALETLRSCLFARTSARSSKNGAWCSKHELEQLDRLVAALSKRHRSAHTRAGEIRAARGEPPSRPRPSVSFVPSNASSERVEPVAPNRTSSQPRRTCSATQSPKTWHARRRFSMLARRQLASRARAPRSRAREKRAERERQRAEAARLEREQAEQKRYEHELREVLLLDEQRAARRRTRATGIEHVAARARRASKPTPRGASQSAQAVHQRYEREVAGRAPRGDAAAVTSRSASQRLGLLGVPPEYRERAARRRSRARCWAVEGHITSSQGHRAKS